MITSAKSPVMLCPECFGAGFKTRLQRRKFDYFEERIYSRCPTCHGRRFVANDGREEAAQDFEKWWNEVGSGCRPGPKDDMESHAHNVARWAWMACFFQSKTVEPEPPTSTMI